MEGLQAEFDIIKSLIAISSGGLLVSKVEREYAEMTNSRLNFRKYGYESLLAMLQSSRDIVLRQTPDGLACRVNDAKMSHVTSLVERTKKSKNRSKKKNYKPRPFYCTTSRNTMSPNRENFPRPRVGSFQRRNISAISEKTVNYHQNSSFKHRHTNFGQFNGNSKNSWKSTSMPHVNCQSRSNNYGRNYVQKPHAKECSKPTTSGAGPSIPLVHQEKSRLVQIPKPINNIQQPKNLGTLKNVSVTFPSKKDTSSDSDWSSDVDTPYTKVNSVVQSASITSSSMHLSNPSSFGCNDVRHVIGGDASEVGITVSGSPSKRTTMSTLRNGFPTIVVKIPNANAANSSQSCKKVSAVNIGPVYKDFEFIGDFLLLRVAKECLGIKLNIQGSIAFCGFCRDNLTLSDCEEEIMRSGAPEKIVLMLGMTDILEGATLDEMKYRTESLLGKLNHSELLLLTLPVPPCFILAGNERKLSILERYNRWLLSLSLNVIDVIDLDHHLYSDAPFFMRVKGADYQTFSEGGCWIVMDEIIGVLG